VKLKGGYNKIYGDYVEEDLKKIWEVEWDHRALLKMQE
jgi:hypothetical protein